MFESVMADFSSCEKAALLWFQSQHKGTMQQPCGRDSKGSAMHSSIFQGSSLPCGDQWVLSREHKSLGETKGTYFKPFFVNTMPLHNTWHLMQLVNTIPYQLPNLFYGYLATYTWPPNFHSVCLCWHLYNKELLTVHLSAQESWAQEETNMMGTTQQHSEHCCYLCIQNL